MSDDLATLNDLKRLKMQVATLIRNRQEFTSNIDMRGSKINGLTTIVIEIKIYTDFTSYYFEIYMKTPSRLNTIDNGAECINDTIWLKEEYINPSIATDIFLYHTGDILEYMKPSIYRCFAELSDQSKYD